MARGDQHHNYFKMITSVFTIIKRRTQITGVPTNSDTDTILTTKILYIEYRGTAVSFIAVCYSRLVSSQEDPFVSELEQHKETEDR